MLLVYNGRLNAMAGNQRGWMRALQDGPLPATCRSARGICWLGRLLLPGAQLRSDKEPSRALTRLTMVKPKRKMLRHCSKTMMAAAAWYC
jgi:hypothetical protein